MYKPAPNRVPKRPRRSRQDKPAFDITGRYYTLDPPTTYVINQAGLHIEGVVSSVIDSSDRRSGDHRPLWGFQGDLRGNKCYWFNRNVPAHFGIIEQKGGDVFIDGKWLRPIEKRPTLISSGDLDRSLNLIDRYELAPLTPVQMAFIRLLLDKGKLEQIFELYFNKQKQGDALGALWRRIKDTPGHASYTARMEKFHEVDLELVRVYAQQVLTFQKWKSQRNVTRSHVEWIQMMLDRTLGPGEAARGFKRYLGINFDPQRSKWEGQHTYEVTIQLTGASLVLAGYTGTVCIEKTNGRKWSQKFDIDFWGGNVSLALFDAKVGNCFKGAARSYLEWTENDVPGSVRLARASASVGMDIASAQAGFMHVLGDGSLPPLDVFFQAAGLGVPNIAKILRTQPRGRWRSS